MALNRAFSQISLLREYRTRLIANVVTGKLDVREAAEGLPEELEEEIGPEEFEDAGIEETEEARGELDNGEEHAPV